MKLGILNDFSGKYKIYIKACEDLGVNYEVIDFIGDNWIEEIKSSDCDGFLVRPSVQIQTYKTLFDERLYFLEYVLKKRVYPRYIETFIYENKKNMATWLEINKIKSAKTHVFYDKHKAIEFIDNKADFPIVFKTNIGSGASGVKIINKKSHARRIINKTFSKFKFYNRGYIRWLPTRFKLSYPLLNDRQFDFVIFQEYKKIKTEWRMIKIGDSFFGHQKLEVNGFHSGSGNVGWVVPPTELFDLTKEICEIGNFNSMNVDIFETVDGEYLVNELQTIFGSWDDSQMYDDGVPGRMKFINNEWVFEEGYFNTNSSFDLRVKDFINILSEND